jgi:hypothetical protein
VNKLAYLRPGTVLVGECMNAGFREEPSLASRCIDLRPMHRSPPGGIMRSEVKALGADKEE